jgi:hypothetical protein
MKKGHDEGMQYSEQSLHTIRDHDALRQSACEIRHMLGGSSCVCGSTGACRCLLESLGAFSRHLHQHFELEEQGWSRSRSINRTSHAQIHALMQEHESIRVRLTAALLALEETQECGGSLSPDLEREIRRILDDLLRHELSEAGLFQRQVLSEADDAQRDRLCLPRERTT